MYEWKLSLLRDLLKPVSLFHIFFICCLHLV